MQLTDGEGGEYGPGSYGSLTRHANLVFGYAIAEIVRCSRNREPKGHRSVGLGEVEADKAIRLLDYVWSRRETTDDRTLVQLPLKSKEDKHGPRVVYPRAWHPSWTESRPSVLETMIAADECFPPAARILRITPDPQPWGVLQRIDGAVTTRGLDPLVARRTISLGDVGMITEFAESCSRLTEWELIAIGRHETAQHTRQAIAHELTRWRVSARYLASLLREPRVGVRLARAGWQLWSFGRECTRKSDSERNDYETGYVKFITAASDQLREAFVRDREDADDIWGNQLVNSLTVHAYGCWHVGQFIVGCLRNHPDLRPMFSRPAISLEDVDRSRDWCQELLAAGPADLPALYVPDPGLGLLSTAPSLLALDDFWEAPFASERIANDLERLVDHIDALLITPVVGPADDSSDGSVFAGDDEIDANPGGGVGPPSA